MTDDTPQSAISAAQAPAETRVVTHAGQRTSVRLEPVFWRNLRRMAHREGLRVGNLIGRVRATSDSGNLTARLRALCMLEAEQLLASAKIDATPASLLRVVDTSPSPALLLGPDTEIVNTNTAFDSWLSPTRMRGLYLAEAFNIRTSRSFRDVWSGLRRSSEPVAGIGLLHISQGRVTAAEATFVPLTTSDFDTGLAAVVWITTRGSKSRKGDQTRPPSQPSTNTSDVSGG